MKMLFSNTPTALVGGMDRQKGLMHWDILAVKILWSHYIANEDLSCLNQSKDSKILPDEG